MISKKRKQVKRDKKNEARKSLVFLLRFQRSSYPTTWSEVNGRPSIEVDAANKTEKWNADAQAGGIKLSTYGGYTGLSLEESKVRISMFSPELMRQMSLTADSADCSIKLSTKETNYNEVSLADYPINWSALAHKPDFQYKLCFGAKRVNVQDSVLHESTATFYPAVRVCEIVTQSNGTSTTSYSSCYYFDSGSWKSFDQSEFVTLEF